MFIDKSLFIKKFLDNGSKCTVILRPRRFGKSLNLSMLKCFLDRQQRGTRELFHNLEIMSHTKLVNDHMGKYPVVFLSLKDCCSPTWAEMRKEVWESLFRMCKSHIGLRNDALHTGTEDTVTWADLMDVTNLKPYPRDFPDEVDDFAIRQVFVRLVERISDLCGMKVIVLVDEYDAPMNIPFESNDDKKRRATFLRGFFSAVLKNNPALEKAMLVGVFETREASILSGLNNLKVLTVANDTLFGDCFGFTESEVRDCLTRVGMHPPDRIQEELNKAGGIREYYNGYCIGQHQIINPWSFMNFLLWEFKASSFWVASGPTDALFTLIRERNVDFHDVLESIEGLLNDDASVCKRLQVAELDPILSIQSMDKFSRDQLLHFLCMTGYLTYQSLDDNEKCGEVWIPNMEIRFEWEKLLAKMNGFDHFADIKRYYQKLANALCLFDVRSIAQFIHEAAKRVSSEHSYQLYIGGILSLLNLAHWRSLCETGSGNGFSDQIISFDDKHQSVVIQYKHSKSRERCLEDAQMGLDQIFERQYFDHVPGNHEALLLGCATWGVPGDVEVQLIPCFIGIDTRQIDIDKYLESRRLARHGKKKREGKL